MSEILLDDGHIILNQENITAPSLGLHFIICLSVYFETIYKNTWESLFKIINKYNNSMTLQDIGPCSLEIYDLCFIMSCLYSCVILAFAPHI